MNKETVEYYVPEQNESKKQKNMETVLNGLMVIE